MGDHHPGAWLNRVCLGAKPAAFVRSASASRDKMLHDLVQMGALSRKQQV